MIEFTNSSPCLAAGSCKELDEETEICLCLHRWIVCMCVRCGVCVCPTCWIGFLFTCLWNKAIAEFKLLLDILLISHWPILWTVYVCVCELIHIAAVVQRCCMVVVNYRFLLCSLQCCVCTSLHFCEKDASFQQHPSHCPLNVIIKLQTEHVTGWQNCPHQYCYTWQVRKEWPDVETKK